MVLQSSIGPIENKILKDTSKTYWFLSTENFNCVYQISYLDQAIFGVGLGDAVAYVLNLSELSRP